MDILFKNFFEQGILLNNNKLIKEITGVISNYSKASSANLSKISSDISEKGGLESSVIE